MKNRRDTMSNHRLVYSTESGRICPRCAKPVESCTCKKKKAMSKPPALPVDGKLHIRYEAKGRKGKPVTAVYGLAIEAEELQRLAKILKQRCASGGTVKEGVILIQGDHRTVVLAEIQRQGYSVKIS